MSSRPLSDFIIISLSRQTTGVTAQGFGTELHLCNNLLTRNRIATVTKGSWATTLTALGFTSSDLIYTSFSDYFAQTPSPNTGYLGLVLSTQQDIQITAYDILTTYTVTVTDASGDTAYTSLAAGSAALAAAEIAGKIAAGSQTVTATDNVDVVEITADPVTTPFTCEGSVAGGAGTISATTSGATEDMDTSLTQIKAASTDWYAIAGTGTLGRTLAQQKLIAAWAESNERLYIVASADASCRDLTQVADASTSIAGYCKTQAMKNTSVIFHGSAATEYLDSAWLGRCLQADPGTINWNHKNLSSVTVDSDLTPTQRTNLGDKGASWYEAVGGSNRTQLGLQKAQNGYGDYIDVTRIAHYLKIRTEEAEAAMLQRVDQVPYTQDGIAMCEAELEGVLKGAKGLESYTIDVPDIDDIATATKVTRHLTGLDYTAIIKGAVNSMAIAGTLTTS